MHHGHTRRCVVTAPDPGLTDLIEAEITFALLRQGWHHGINVTPIAAHVALAVEQHTNGRNERIKTVLDAGANILDMHAAMLDNLVMDTPHDQARSDQIATQARRAAKSFRAALEGEQQ